MFPSGETTCLLWYIRIIILFWEIPKSFVSGTACCSNIWNAPKDTHVAMTILSASWESGWEWKFVSSEFFFFFFDNKYFLNFFFFGLIFFFLWWFCEAHQFGKWMFLGGPRSFSVKPEKTLSGQQVFSSEERERRPTFLLS